MRPDLLDLELPKLRKARQITEAEHDGAVYWPEALVSGDLHPREYFSSIDELREACERESVAVPLWVWPCSGRSMKLSAKQILERELDSGEYFEDADVSPAEIGDGQRTVSLEQLELVRTQDPATFAAYVDEILYEAEISKTLRENGKKGLWSMLAKKYGRYGTGRPVEPAA